MNFELEWLVIIKMDENFELKRGVNRKRGK